MAQEAADTELELLEMADKIGVARKWYQQASSTPHFDICKSKRSKAVKLGAIELETRHEMVELLRRLRK